MEIGESSFDQQFYQKDKLFTGGLLVLTLFGILVLFWFQNFGPGFEAFNEGSNHWTVIVKNIQDLDWIQFVESCIECGNF